MAAERQTKDTTTRLGATTPVGEDVVELVRFMENHVPLPQPVAGAVRHHFDLALVHVEQFPKIVFFSFKDIVFGVFKIMHRHDGVDRHLPAGGRWEQIGAYRLLLLV